MSASNLHARAPTATAADMAAIGVAVRKDIRAPPNIRWDELKFAASLQGAVGAAGGAAGGGGAAEKGGQSGGHARRRRHRRAPAGGPPGDHLARPRWRRSAPAPRD
eukprot:1012818-Prorocentrum_minimum.AAC.1